MTKPFAGQSAPTSASSWPTSTACAAKPRCTSRSSSTTVAANSDKPVLMEGVGKEYLASLRENATRAARTPDPRPRRSVQMHRMFAPLDEEITCKRDGTGKMLLDIAHLIDHKCVERYQNSYSTAAINERVPDAALRPLAAVPLRPPPVQSASFPLRAGNPNQGGHPRLSSVGETRKAHVSLLRSGLFLVVANLGGEAHLLVTFNRKDFGPVASNGKFKVVTPAEALREIRRNDEEE